MIDGIETSRVVANEELLIRRLNISAPFSLTFGNLRKDLALTSSFYKGLIIKGVPRGHTSLDGDRYWFRIKGSLIKMANGGRHNADFKDPIEILYALDDLITHLRINPFRTLLNGIELSTTVQSSQAKWLCNNITSYLNRPPFSKEIRRDNQQMFYTEVVAGQHKLKLYTPIKELLRYELKIDRMQYLGDESPIAFADLVQPRYIPNLVSKLLDAFRKIVWKCPNLNLLDLVEEERWLYLKGQDHAYWKVTRSDFLNKVEFDRVAKQRYREKEQYSDLIKRHWLEESPWQIEQRIVDQLNKYEELMHTQLYQTLLTICIERWNYVENLPFIIRLPKRLKLPHLSEIYSLYRDKGSIKIYSSQSSFFNQERTTSTRNEKKSQQTIELFASVLSASVVDQRQITPVEKYRLMPTKLLLINNLQRVKKKINIAGGLNYTLSEIESILPAKTRLWLAENGQSLAELTRKGSDLPPSLPLFAK